MDSSFFSETFISLMKALPLTLNLTVLSLAGGGCLALALNLLRLTPVGAWFYRGYVFLFRGTPLLIQIFMIYYGLGSLTFIHESVMWPVLRSPYWCGLIALILNDAAYTSEILRGGLNAVTHQSTEAAKVSGMSTVMRLRRITLPIAVRQALPAYSNEIISMLKSTSLVSTISLMEMTGMADAIVSSTFRALEVFLIAAIIYLVISVVVSYAISCLEKHLSPQNFGVH
ncbi:ABC transporter permease [Pantoea cypripedii]|uniref:Arginine ABC transporter permease protein ArtM n=2 Tax=Pantoea cypripedii TaxID=55209 RepID=A0A1X1EM68_PANCY|nr:ABC transporter permease subunit [Pantoea cypripedii]MBP2199936.1 octopine/nopaline transport system permease protein [Pantoea cypripedii]ORM89884.1 ABC transporter permease [Pantoea cypripedii]